MKARRWVLVIVALVLVLVGVGILRALQARRAQEAAAAAPRPPLVLELSAADIVTAGRVELQRGVTISGTVRAANSAYLKARVAAEIRELAVREGDAVKAGQVLARQDTTEFDWRVRQAEQQAASAKAQLDIAQRALDNNKALVAQGFISSTALESSASNQSAAEANLQAALAAVEIARKSRSDATLTAPMSGIVSQRLVQPGERVGVDAKILEIVDLSRLEIEAALAPEDVVGLRVGQPARVTVDGINAEIGARVVRINPVAQAGSRTVPVYLALDTHAALRQGLFARGRIEQERQQVLAVPASAVRSDRADPYVLALDGGAVTARTIRTGLRGQAAGRDMVQVVEGLAESAQVLSGTGGAVPDGTRWKAAPAAAPRPSAPAASAASATR